MSRTWQQNHENIKYILFDLKKLSPEILEFSPQLRYTLGIMRDRHHADKVKKWIQQLLQCYSGYSIEIVVFYYYTFFGTRLEKQKLRHLYEEEQMGLKKFSIEDLEEGTPAWHTAMEILTINFEKGMEKGIEQGREQGIEIVAISLLDTLDDQTIALKTNLPLAKVRQLRIDAGL